MKKPSKKSKKLSRKARKLTAMVLDDHAWWRESVCSIVESSLGVAPLAASNGREALDILKSQRIDIVISDLNMPEMNGVQFLQQARRISPETKVIIMSAEIGPDSAVSQELIDRGAFGVTSKLEITPNLENLLATIKTSE